MSGNELALFVIVALILTGVGAMLLLIKPEGKNE